MATKKIPTQSCCYQVPVKFAEDGGDGKAAVKEQRFHMVANTGKPMNHWWFGILAIDLAGMTVREPVPILLSHDVAQRVGFSDKVETTKQGLEISGKLLAGTPERDQLIADAKAGFPFQASVWAAPRNIEEVQAGASAQVNGYTLQGPATIFRKSVLRESSFCVLGVDDQTTSSVLSAGKVPVGETEVTVEEPSMTTPKPAAEAAAAPQPEQGKTAQTPAPASTPDTALAAESTRVETILKAAIPAQFDLAKKLIADKTPTVDAVLALNADLRQRHTQATGAPADRQKADGTLATPSPEAGQGADAQLAAMPDGEAKWKLQWQKDAALQAEFGGNEKRFLAYCRNKSKTLHFGPGAAKA